MSIGKAVSAILTGDAAVAALVGTRVWPMRLKQGTLQTSITYQRISAARSHTHDGPVGLNGSRIQVDCWAATYGAADALATAVRRALDNYEGTAAGIRIQRVFLDDESDEFEEATDADRVRLDFIIHHEELI